MNRRDFMLLTAANGWCMDKLLAYPSAKLISRSIPSTGESLPIIGLGTWRVFNVNQESTARSKRKKILSHMIDIGGKIIDTSPMYGNSQTIVGELTQELKARSSFFYANKVWTNGRESGIEQMTDSFNKMKTSVIDLMQVHNLIDVKTHLTTLKAMKEEGKIKYIGITHYQSGAYPEMMRLIKTEKLDFVQFNYNIARREAEKELLPLAKEFGLAVIVNRPFEEGALFNIVQNKKLPVWAPEYKITSWAQYFLKFVISHPAVTYTIPATSNPIHMIENLTAATTSLPDETVRNKMIKYFESRG